MATASGSNASPSAAAAKTKHDEVVALFEQYVVPNYKRYPVTLVRGSGSHVWDSEGQRYLDLFPGWGCNLLGHCPAEVVRAVRDQVEQLIHVPNTWYTESQGRWAAALAQRSFGGQAFFCNSGAEANEAAIKLARLHTPESRYKIITFEGGFHGRTLAATTATAQPKYHAGLGPLMAGFVYAPFGDLAAVADLVDEETAAILIEPIQGEGGIRIPPDGFLAGLRQLADEHELLLMFDEVQAGCGRTGHWFGYQNFGVTPDVMTLAKSVCGGVAGGALLTTAEIAKSLRPGMHASTFGGNPLAAEAGLAVIRTIEEQNLLQRASELSEIFGSHLSPLVDECEHVREVRILGLMIGIELSVPATNVVQTCLERKLLVNCTQETVVRLLPALTLSDELAHEGCQLLCEVIRAAA
ncbi:MAG: aspartate aminotransferase family protein [Planctomycetota bacterium]|nr:MAG: aspartate aminotransferase family protein [Planctomycetota bacterium]REJ90360.1 MAG: aspartate aminotransferase family protein [Planctomycetota bacterium]REK17821.1 MAG: aspartate aminotransferase family protein [Planctomycetota bacterium]REK41005.1 MAG: aspartate aminotransferase family protein [Planctomycetota bacterium]